MVLCPEPPSKLTLPERTIIKPKDDDNHDSPKLEKRTRMHLERHRSCVLALSDNELNSHRLLQTLEVSKSPGGGSQCWLHEETPTDPIASHRHAIADAAWEALKRSIVYFRGETIGTVAAIDKSQGAALNYDQVFMRDFISSALAFLMNGEHLIVKNFLVETARLQSREKMVDLFKLSQGVMPASFQVHHRNPTQKEESLLADFGETAIGRVAPVDSVLWWIILLCAYTKWTGDNSLAESPNCQRAMNLILRLCLSEGCDTSPAFLCADGCSMIDRRMGIYDYPVEIQALLFMSMRCALSLLMQDSNNFVNHITKRIQDLSHHLHNFIANITPARMDFQWFYLGVFIDMLSSLVAGEQAEAILDLVEQRYRIFGNFIAILSSLATGAQAEAIMDLVEEHWQELIGEMPLDPGLENQPWQIITGCDPKNTSRNSESPNCQWTASRTLLCAVGCSCSLADILRLYFSEGRDTRMAMSSVNENGHSNTAVVCLDDLETFIITYLNAIGRLRRWCEINGTRFDLSGIFGSKIVVFTTPPSGTFYFILKCGMRSLTFALYGRNLYVNGWRGPQGTFEMKAESEKRRNYMSGETVKVLPFKKNYRFLAPEGEVGKVRIGFYALSEAFEVLHKCDSENKEVKRAVATVAVHFAEGGRLQSVVKDICSVSIDCTMDTLNGRSNNSFWVENYGHYAEVEMDRIDHLVSGKTPPAIKDTDDAIELKIQISEAQILNQIRIFPHDGFGGVFQRKPAPLEPTENDSVGSCSRPKGMKLQKKCVISKQGRNIVGNESWEVAGDSQTQTRSKEPDRGLEKLPIGDGTFPLYLLEDWCLEEQKEEEQEEKENEEEDDVPKLRKMNVKAISGEKWIEDFLDSFPSVRKLLTPNTSGEQSQDLLGHFRDMTSRRSLDHFHDVTTVRSLDHFRDVTVVRSQLVLPLRLIEEVAGPGTIRDRLVKQSYPARANFLLKGARIISRVIRLAV